MWVAVPLPDVLGEPPLLWSSPYVQSHQAKLSPGLGNPTLNQASSGFTLFSAAQGTNHSEIILIV